MKMSSFCIANLLSPSTKSTPVRPPSVQKSPPISKSFNLPTDNTSLLSTADLLQMASATMMNSYNQQNLASVFSPTLPNAYPFAQLPPFFVNGFPSNGYFAPNGTLFQPNGIMLQQLSGRRKRRHRTIFTDEQLAVLESNFSSNQYPDVTLREKLALQCDLKEERVEVWFKNRRAKERKKRHDFPCDLPSGSTESRTVSPFFDRSSSSEHKVTDESDCEDFMEKRVPNFMSASLDAILQSQISNQNNQQSNKRKKRHSDNIESSPVAKKSRTMDKTQVKIE